jgi:hypothetical protein
LNVKANGEIISTRYCYAVKRFLRPRQARIGHDRCAGERFAPVRVAQQTTFFSDSKNETIVARERKSSVSHFIDCDPVARKLCASPRGRYRRAGQPSIEQRDSRP